MELTYLCPKRAPHLEDIDPESARTIYSKRATFDLNSYLAFNHDMYKKLVRGPTAQQPYNFQRL